MSDEREKKLRDLAANYAESVLKHNGACHDLQRAKTAADNAKIEEERNEKLLHEFVGRNEREKFVRVKVPLGEAVIHIKLVDGPGTAPDIVTVSMRPLI